MKIVLRNPPLLILVTAIVLDLPVRRVLKERSATAQGWAARKLLRLIEWRDDLSRRAS